MTTSFVLRLIFIIVFTINNNICSSSSFHFVAASYETWAEAFEAIYATFKDERIVKDRLHELMEPVLHGNSVPYADAFCAKGELINCRPAHGGDQRGSSQSLAWALDLTIDDLDFTTSVDRIQWSKLPKVVQRLNIKRCLLPSLPSESGDDEEQAAARSADHRNGVNIAKKKKKQRQQKDTLSSSKKENPRNAVDISKIVSRVPKTVREVHFSFCDGIAILEEKFDSLVAESHLPDRHHNRDKTSGVEGLYFDHCVFEESFLSENVALPWFHLLGIRRLRLEASRFRSTTLVGEVKLPALISRMDRLEELSLVVNRGRVIHFDKIIQAVAANSSGSLMTLNIDLDDHDESVSSARTVDVDVKYKEDGGKVFDEQKTALQLSHLSSAEHFRFSNIPFTRVPPLPTSLKSLTLLFADIKGDFPSDLASFYNLEKIDLTGNSIDNIDLEKSIPSTLKRIVLAGNLLHDEALLADLSKLPRHLIEFNVSGNDLSGTNTMDFSKLPPKIEVFDISYNRLSGPVKISGQLPDSIKYFCINDNDFTGRYDVAKLPLLSVKIAIGNNNWDSLMPPR